MAYIDRNELINNLNKFAPEHYNALINQLIVNQPTADVVEVVRCKDCKNYNAKTDFKDRLNWGTCTRISFLSNELSERFDDDFCSYGERKPQEEG